MNGIDIWNDLGNLYLKANAINSAIDAYNKAIEQGYQTGDIYKNLAGAYVSQGKIVDSIPLYKKSIELLNDDKDKARVYTHLGDSFRRIADFDNAIAAFKSAIEIEPGNPALCIGLSEVQRDLEKIYGFDTNEAAPSGDGLQLIDGVAMTVDPDLSQMPSEAMDDLLLEGSKEDLVAPATPDEEQLVEKEENDTYPWEDLTERVVVDEMMQANSESETNAGRVETGLTPTGTADVAIEDNMVEDLNLGDSSLETDKVLDEIPVTGENDLVRGQDEDEAVRRVSNDDQNLDETVNREKEDGVRVTLLLTLGIMHWRNGDLEEADGILQSAINDSVKIKNNWFEALAWHALALVKTDQGDIVAAIHAYLRAVELAPDQIFPWNNIGSLYDSMGCSDKAMAAFQKAIRQNPEDSTSWDGVGDIFTKLGRLDDAIAAYQLGNIFEKTPQGDDAIKAYEKAFDFYHFTIAPFESEVSKIQDDLGQIAGKDAGQKDELLGENQEPSQVITEEGNDLTNSMTVLDCELKVEDSCENGGLEPEIPEVINEIESQEDTGRDSTITLESAEEESIAPEVSAQPPQQEMSLPIGWVGDIEENIEYEAGLISTSIQGKSDADSEMDEIFSGEINLQETEDAETKLEIVEPDSEEFAIEVDVEPLQEPKNADPEQAEFVGDALLGESRLDQDLVEYQVAVPGEASALEAINEQDAPIEADLENTLVAQDEHLIEDKEVANQDRVAGNPLQIEAGVFVDEINSTESSGNERGQGTDSALKAVGSLSGGNLNPVTEQILIATEEEQKDELSGTAEDILPPVVSVDTEPAPKADAEKIAGTIASYEVVVKQNPQNVRAWDSLGNLYRITQRNGDAIHAFERAVSLEPTKYVFHYQLGALYAAEGNFTDAIREIQKVVDLNPAFIFAHCALASYLRKMGQDEEAQDHIAIALPFMANEKEYDRACFESIRGNIDGALELLTIALEKKQTTIEWIRRDLDLDFIRHDSRYEQLEARFTQSVVEY